MGSPAASSIRLNLGDAGEFDEQPIWNYLESRCVFQIVDPTLMHFCWVAGNENAAIDYAVAGDGDKRERLTTEPPMQN